MFVCFSTGNLDRKFDRRGLIASAQHWALDLPGSHRLMDDGDSKIDAKKRTGDPQSDAQACVLTTHWHLPAPPALEPLLRVGHCVASRAADDTQPTSPIQLRVRLAPNPIDPIAEDPIAALQRQLEEQRMWIASLRSLCEEQQSAQRLWNASSEERSASLRSLCEEQQSAQRLWNASSEERSAPLAERVGKLELSGKAVAELDVIISVSPDAHEATGDKPEAVAETDPDATVQGADTGELELKSDLDESMWDSTLFLGRPDLGINRVVTLWAVLILLLNMLLQTTIAIIVVLNMGDPTFAANVIEDLWYASEPRFASACHVVCPRPSFTVPGAAADAAVGLTASHPWDTPDDGERAR
jgi:hypothetical protein